MDVQEKQRVEKLLSYKILDTAPDQELDELTRIASLILETPISLISLLDGQRQWFKSKFGLEVSQTPKEDSLCKEAIKQPKEVLVVPDARKDARFMNSNLVTGSPNIRFYAGAPLVTTDGYALGTLCVIDSKPRNLSASQKQGLQMLAQKVVDFIESRYVIDHQQKKIAAFADRIESLANSAPGMLFQFTMNQSKEITFEFMSEGISEFFPSLDRKTFLENRNSITEFMHPDDVPGLIACMYSAYERLQGWSYEYRTGKTSGNIAWHEVRANPKLIAPGVVRWYGTVQDITDRKEYEETLEEIAFDISHVLRRPVTTTMGLASWVKESKDLQVEDIQFIMKSIGDVADELDVYTKFLNETYTDKKRLYQQRSKMV